MLTTASGLGRNARVLLNGIIVLSTLSLYGTADNSFAVQTNNIKRSNHVSLICSLKDKHGTALIS